MKRSKLFLGISTGVLAVVAFTAAKTAKFSALNNAYYPDPANSNKCTLKASLQFYSNGTTLATNGREPSANLYTFNSGQQCTNALFATEGTD